MSRKNLPLEARNLAITIAQELEGFYTEEAIIYIQAKAMLESGFATSRLCVEYNNCFGMMQPNVRNTLSQGPTPASEGLFATFQSKVQSIQDLKLYYDYWAANGKSSSLMISDIQEPKYASDPYYASKIGDIRASYYWPTWDGQLVESSASTASVGNFFSGVSTKSWLFAALGLFLLLDSRKANKYVKKKVAYGKKSVSRAKRNFAKKYPQVSRYATKYRRYKWKKKAPKTTSRSGRYTTSKASAARKAAAYRRLKGGGRGKYKK